jgi:hypothetical protein
MTQMSADVRRCPCLTRFLPQQSEIAYKTVPSAYCRVRRHETAYSQPYAPGTHRKCCRCSRRDGDLIEHLQASSSVVWAARLYRARFPQMSVFYTSAGPFRTESCDEMN